MGDIGCIGYLLSGCAPAVGVAYLRHPGHAVVGVSRRAGGGAEPGGSAPFAWSMVLLLHLMI